MKIKKCNILFIKKSNVDYGFMQEVSKKNLLKLDIFEIWDLNDIDNTIDYSLIILDYLDFDSLKDFKQNFNDKPLLVMQDNYENIKQILALDVLDIVLNSITSELFIHKIENYCELIDAQTEIKNQIKQQTDSNAKTNTDFQYLHFNDNLTKIKNRNSLLTTIKTDKSATEVILVDVNSFSRINDIYGEDVGDKVLISVAKKLDELSGNNWDAYRYSGDHFVLLSNKPHSLSFCEQKADIVYQELDNLTINTTHNKTDLEVAISVTMAISKDDSREHLLEQADMALKYAKQTKHKIITYSQSLQIEEQYAKDLKAIEMVKKALEEDRIIPYFQPIIKNDGVRSYECLVRIIDGDKVISPFFFIDSIKHSKYYIELTKRMISKTFETFTNQDATFSINLSFEDISNGDLREYIKSKIIEFEIYDKLILEILESESIGNFNIVREFLTEVKELGVKIAIDDFGSGYSNFSYIAELMPDFVKVDGSIIKNIDHDEDAYTIAKTIADFTNKMGMKAIAEFIHSDDVYQKAKEIGFFGFQGYELGEPKATI